jgi:hypothetical protein
MLEPKELHVTICYSKEPLVWESVPDTKDEILVPALDDLPDDVEKPVRKIEMFGKEKNVLVIQFESDELRDRWQEFMDAGASYDFPEYKSHITITYKSAGLDEDELEPYRGEILLGPEVFQPIERDDSGDPKEFDPAVPFEAEGEALTEAQIEERNGIRFWKNPGRSEIASLVERHDLRGVTDGRDLYIWDANRAIHYNACLALGYDANALLDFSFYVNHEVHGGDINWSELTEKKCLRLRGYPDVVIHVEPKSWPQMAHMPCFVRLIDREADRPLEESAVPRKFWLCLEVPVYDRSTNSEASQQLDAAMLRDISAGTLHGCKGISASREIVTQYFGGVRNACLVMNSNAVMKINDVEAIRYDDPDFLCRDDFRPLYRLWSKDPTSDMGRRGFFINLYQYMYQVIAKQNRWLSISLENAMSLVEKTFLEGPNIPVNSFDEAARWMWDLIIRARDNPNAGRYSSRALERDSGDLTPGAITEGLLGAIKHVGRIYSDEAEWIVGSGVFHIPEGSVMLIGVQREVMENFQDWKDNRDAIKYWSQRYRYENFERLLERLATYRLRERYQVRFIDLAKYEKVRDHFTMPRRTARRYPQTQF